MNTAQKLSVVAPSLDQMPEQAKPAAQPAPVTENEAVNRQIIANRNKPSFHRQELAAEARIVLVDLGMKKEGMTAWRQTKLEEAGAQHGISVDRNSAAIAHHTAEITRIREAMASDKAAHLASVEAINREVDSEMADIDAMIAGQEALLQHLAKDVSPVVIPPTKGKAKA